MERETEREERTKDCMHTLADCLRVSPTVDGEQEFTHQENEIQLGSWFYLASYSTEPRCEVHSLGVIRLGSICQSSDGRTTSIRKLTVPHNPLNGQHSQCSLCYKHQEAILPIDCTG